MDAGGRKYCELCLASFERQTLSGELPICAQCVAGLKNMPVIERMKIAQQFVSNQRTRDTADELSELLKELKQLIAASKEHLPYRMN